MQPTNKIKNLYKKIIKPLVYAQKNPFHIVPKSP